MIDLLASRGRRRFLFAALYFCEGAPIGFLWWCLPTILRAEGVGADTIGLVIGLLVWPWALKWMWSPLVDRWQGPRWTLRSWIVAAQCGMIACLVPLFFVSPASSTGALIALLLAHAVFASTQDASIDALVVAATEPEERGRLTACMQGGMLTGRSLLGGGALLLRDDVGDAGILAVLVSVLVVGLALAFFYRPVPPRERRTGASLREHLTAALASRRVWAGLGFAATAGAGFEAVGGFAGPMLVDASGGEVAWAGTFFTFVAPAATAGGGFVGGASADRLGTKIGTTAAGLVVAAAVFGVSAALAAGAGAVGTVVGLTFVYVAIGAFVAASYALFLEHTDTTLGATQFSAYMGATNLCEAGAVAAAGALIPTLGYAGTFAGIELAALAALALLLAMRPHAAVQPSLEGPSKSRSKA